MGLEAQQNSVEEFQAAWYFRYAILAFANHVETIFIDMKGQGQHQHWWKRLV